MMSSGLPLEAPAAMRANFHRCCIEPLSFAVEQFRDETLPPSSRRQVCALPSH